jgi:hypothetical protein
VKIKEKNNKGGLGCGRLPPYPVGTVPCSTEMQQTLIFWPLHLLVLRAVTMSCPVRLYAVEDG